MSFTIRPTTREDTAQIFSFICQLAEYERMSDQVVTDEAQLERALFDEQGARCVLAFEESTPVGFALYFYNFSTFEGARGLHLEDLFVLPEKRGRGYGKKLLLHLVQIAQNEGCHRMEWTCLDWNKPSIAFYQKLGAEAQNEWIIFRLTKEKIRQLTKERG